MAPEGTVTRPVAGYEGRFDLFGWPLVRAVVHLRRSLPRSSPRLIDLGSGRGRDLLYFAKHGFRVEGIDRDSTELAKAQRRAHREGVRIATRVADLRTLRIRDPVDVVFSSTALNHLPPDLRARRFADFQRATRPGGVHAVNAFVRVRGSAPPPDVAPGLTYFRRGELRRYYRSWEVLHAETRVLPCVVGPPAHVHAAESLVARRPPDA